MKLELCSPTERYLGGAPPCTTHIQQSSSPVVRWIDSENPNYLVKNPTSSNIHILGPPLDSVQLVNITKISLGFMVVITIVITIVRWGYKQAYNVWGPHIYTYLSCVSPYVKSHDLPICPTCPHVFP